MIDLAAQTHLIRHARPATGNLYVPVSHPTGQDDNKIIPPLVNVKPEIKTEPVRDSESNFRVEFPSEFPTLVQIRYELDQFWIEVLTDAILILLF